MTITTMELQFNGLNKIFLYASFNHDEICKVFREILVDTYMMYKDVL